MECGRAQGLFHTFSTTTFTQDDVLHAAMSFPRGSAAGPSGLRPSHLRESLQCEASAVESDLMIALTDFCNLCAFDTGTLPASITQVLLTSSLFPSRKALSREDTVIGGVRTIASGETLRRLVAKCVLWKVQDRLKTVVSTLQCGVAVSDAGAHAEVSFTSVKSKVHIFQFASIIHCKAGERVA